MRPLRNTLPDYLLAVAGLSALGIGWWTGNLFLGSAVSAILACLFAWRMALAAARRDRSSPAERSARTNPASEAGQPGETHDSTEQLVRLMLGQGRYSLLLRPQVANGLSDEQVRRAREELDREMALVPAGRVRMVGWRGDDADGETVESARYVDVQPLLLDRHPVTNVQYLEFVREGGYQQMSLWDPAIWPAVLDFVDSTGCPGPRYWRNGDFERGLEDHPVVGVCWYEALAYARWVGKRLVTDPEWVKAGCWPVATSDQALEQRKFPWGDTMQRQKANLWGTGPSRTCSVRDFPDGVSVGGVYHLIGNVWEWTGNNFAAWDADSRRLRLKTPMKSLRGGAFDTYFENQASCHFQSGDSPLARKHNIGFRCALSLCDLAPQVLDYEDTRPEGAASQAAPEAAIPRQAVAEIPGVAAPGMAEAAGQEAWSGRNHFAQGEIA